MQTRSKNIHVFMPDDRVIEVNYYCSDLKIADAEKEKFTRLYIQLDDCISTIKIEKILLKSKNKLEHIVQKKVINERGHLC